MKPMFLSEVEGAEPQGLRADTIRGLRAQGVPVPQILHLLSYKPDRTDHLSRFTQAVLRGPSPLPPGMRELIAAFTSKRNACPF